MTPHKQLYGVNDPSGHWGDCGRTVIACLLDMRPEDVPHFWDEPHEGRNIRAEVSEWLAERGIEVWYVPVHGDHTLDEIMWWMRVYNPGKTWVLQGKSRNDTDHVVICRDDEIIHDTSNDESGIIGPGAGNWYWIEIYARPLG